MQQALFYRFAHGDAETSRMRIRLELTGSKVAVSFLLQWYLCWAANRCVLNPVGLQRSPETIGQETLAATQASRETQSSECLPSVGTFLD